MLTNRNRTLSPFSKKDVVSDSRNSKRARDIIGEEKATSSVCKMGQALAGRGRRNQTENQGKGKTSEPEPGLYEVQGSPSKRS